MTTHASHIVLLSVFSIFLFGNSHTKVESAEIPSTISDRHADLLSKLSHYELVRPYRSTHEGEFVTHELSTDMEEELHDFHRARRQTRSPNRHSRSVDDEQPSVHFAVDAFGSRLTLTVKRNRYIAAPTFKVERHMEDGERVIYKPRTNCFYSGHVQNSSSSTVAVSNCQGMSGLIRVEDEEYIIEPVDHAAGASNEGANVTEGHLHIMYRRKDWSGDTNHFDTNYNYTHPRLFDDEMYKQPNTEPDESTNQSGAGGGRQKRQSISTYDRQHHIETLITADYYVHDFHGESYIVTYLMTMMHIVNVAYAHPSLEANIDLTVIKIILLNSAQSRNMVVENNAPSSLTNVCQWAYSQSSPDENNPDHYDHAVFLTRENFGPAGIAMIEVMCEPWYCQWSLCKDGGLLSSFVVAHEIGHILGMEHDGQGGNSCAEDAMTGSIMAPVVIAVYNLFFWSDCSRTELYNYLWRYTCLYDDPFDNGYAELEEHPGERYSMDEQCRFDFGNGWKVCRQGDDEMDQEQWSSLFSFSPLIEFANDDPEYDDQSSIDQLSISPDGNGDQMEFSSSEFGEYNPCEQLWCVDINDPYYCKTKKGPPLDGTTCAPGMWCMQGECVYTDTERQDGQWSEWSEWSHCSYQCDTGAEVRTRECNDPPPLNGGNPCKGYNLDYRLCNTQECSRRGADRRAAQCDENLGNWMFRGRLHTWLPQENRNKTLQCRLTCISAQTKDAVVTDYDVADGTPCSYDDHESVCIQGKCVHIGCNKRIDEPYKEDMCGVCMGDHTNCDLIQGSYQQPPAINYKVITTIPAGARNIDVQDITSTDHFIAVKKQGTKNYVLNAKKRQAQSHDFVFAGARFVYVNDHGVERLQVKGPIIFPIIIAIFWTSDTRPANISYQWHVNLLEDTNKYVQAPEPKPPKPPKRVTPRPSLPENPVETPEDPNAIPEIDPELIVPDVNTDNRYIWEAVGWTPCTITCGGGKTYYQYQCTSRATGKRIKYKMCGQNKYNPKGITRKCNTQSCDATPGTENDPPVESNPTNSNPSTNQGGGGGGGGGTDTPVVSTNKPLFLWDIGQWEECSRTCGTEGKQIRSVRCMKVRASGNSSTNPKRCSGEAPGTKQNCNRHACNAFWSVGDWTECSATCGTGTQTRVVVCPSVPGEFECFADEPLSVRDCEIEPCPSAECVPMKAKICKPKMYKKYCDLPGYSDMCCTTCEEMKSRRAAQREQSSVASETPEEQDTGTQDGETPP